MNAQLQIKVKGVFTVKLLRKLIQQTDKYHNGCVFKALFLVAFYGFFRLASLLPPASAMFDKTRFPVIGDLIWGNPGVHLIVTCAKNMHTSGQYQVVQLPIIQDGDLCPVIALRTMVKYLGKHGNWRSEAVWTYLQNTPTAASTIPTTFQQLLC